MTAAQFRTTLDRIGLSQVAASKLLQVNDRTVRTWALDQSPIPHAVAILLRLLASGAISLDDVEKASKKA